EEGYLTNLADWNQDIAVYLAQEEKVEMSDSHWEVVNFLPRRLRMTCQLCS
ncbi:MAG: TusE/DsrC/DsvC family sulfur relay protein, partial [Clostridiales bacterium]|nr:TusE/DsrC/DsvC family sulfur relay protein [Clostridiales bacterium]